MHQFQPKNDRRVYLLCLSAAALLALLCICSLFVGKYPLSLSSLLEGDPMQSRVFWNLRFSRMLMGACGGLILGICGFTFQTVFRNPLASPDVIGVASGASTGAAAGILFFSGMAAVTASAFAGALMAVILAICLSSLDRSGRSSTIVLAGIAVHALAQTALMCLKLTADPERELASIEYWMMGGLNDVSLHDLPGCLLTGLACVFILFILHRQLILLSNDEGEARMLGVNAPKLRLIVLLVATLAVASVISRTGLISFIGLIAPHSARLLSRSNRRGCLVLSGLIGGCLLVAADILARCTAASELPVGIFTSLLGAPFLVFLIIRGRCRV